MNLHHKALAHWSLAIKATDVALKRLESIGSSNCNNEAYVTTQLATAEDHLEKALGHIHAISLNESTPRTGGSQKKLKGKIAARSPAGELARLRAMKRKEIDPDEPDAPSSKVWSNGFPSHEDGCDCSQCDGGVTFE